MHLRLTIENSVCIVDVCAGLVDVRSEVFHPAVFLPEHDDSVYYHYEYEDHQQESVDRCYYH